MPRYAFTLQIGGLDISQGCYEDVLYQAGCDDALVAVVDGDVMVDFIRDARSFQAAVGAAGQEIERAGAHVVRVLRDAGGEAGLQAAELDGVHPD
jgi:hypothetical protein